MDAQGAEGEGSSRWAEWPGGLLPSFDLVEEGDEDLAQALARLGKHLGRVTVTQGGNFGVAAEVVQLAVRQ